MKTVMLSIVMAMAAIAGTAIASPLEQRECSKGQECVMAEAEKICSDIPCACDNWNKIKPLADRCIEAALPPPEVPLEKACTEKWAKGMCSGSMALQEEEEFGEED